MIGEVVGRLGVVFVVRLGVSILPSLYFRRVFVRFLREKKEAQFKTSLCVTRKTCLPVTTPI